MLVFFYGWPASGFSRQLQVYRVIKGDHAAVPVDCPLDLIKKPGPGGLLQRNVIRIGAQQRDIFLGGKIPCPMEQSIANIGKAVLFRNHRPGSGLPFAVFLRLLLAFVVVWIIVALIGRVDRPGKRGVPLVAAGMIGNCLLYTSDAADE